MPSAVPARRPMLGGVLVIVGGALAAIGGFLEWGKLTDPSGGQPLTIEGGALAIALGFGLAVFGVLVLVMPSKGLRVLFGILALLGGLFMGLLGIGAFSNDVWASVAVDGIADELGITFSGTERQAAIDELVGSIESGAIGKEVNVTLYGLPLGALIAIAGAIVGLATAGKGARAPMASEGAGPFASGVSYTPGPTPPTPPPGEVPPPPVAPPAPPPPPEGGSA